MNTLLNFITRNRPLVILVTLVSMSLFSLIIGAEASFISRGITRIVSVTTYPILTTQNSIRNSGFYLYGLFLDYDNVIDDAETLREDIVRLKTVMGQRNELFAENRRFREQLDFIESAPRFTLQPARIIESFKGTLTIDRGRIHGIVDSMAVITDRGVVGVVVEVNDFSSIIATLHHADCKIGAMVQRNRLRAYDGVIHASGNDWGYICTMEYIDMKNDVRQGDMVVTSPESNVPSGFPIGTVSRVYQTGSLWKTGEIEPFVDPYSLDEVYVILRASEESMMLAGPDRIINTASKAQEQPDNRTIQEKLAP